MSKILVNLTFVAVIEEIDLFLSINPTISSCNISKVEMRKRLLMYVLPRCQDRFKWVDKSENFPFEVNIPNTPLTLRLEIESLIQEGLSAISDQESHDSQSRDNSPEPNNKT